MNKQNVTQMMRILMIEPGKAPYPMDAPDDIQLRLDTIGSPIDVLSPTPETLMFINADGKKLGLRLNRRLPNGELIYGTAYITGDFHLGRSVSLSESEIHELSTLFAEIPNGEIE
ncbi:MAG: DUF3846 domain-containing protein [Clostridia bacterium]|nr:DUF3846 domain-containing protein [Clostridia bacterium]